MLMPGARRNLFKDAYSELKKMVTENPSPPQSEENLARKIINKQAEDMKDSVLVRDARLLFEELRELKTEQEGWLKTWRVIQGVWIEMLCFPAVSSSSLGPDLHLPFHLLLLRQLAPSGPARPSVAAIEARAVTR
jgi:hypothetical protein